MLVCAFPASAAPFVWIESEKPTSANIPLKDENTGHPEFLSEGKWLKVSIEAEKVEKEVPADGAVLTYKFSVATPGDYEIWNRIGYEFVRSPFEWRVDAGEWAGVSPDELTTDLMELSFFTEVAWLKLGRQSLAAGEHTLAIRLQKANDRKGKAARILYASDALCITPAEFHPNGKFKPGEDWRTDADRAAGGTVFTLPPDKAGNQSVELNGPWEVCRHDEQAPGETAEPIRDFPAEPHWVGIDVPGDKNKARPDLIFAHRLWYRTRVVIPPGYSGQSFYLDFPENNLNTTVFVNGHFCGFNKNPFARFQIDITEGVHAGTNEIRVGIKDAWYGRSTSPSNPLKLRKTFNLPEKFFHDGFQDLAYPIWNHSQSGILVTPALVAAGRAYAADVFVKPSVANKQLAAEITIANSSDQGVAGELVCEAVNDKSGVVEKTFAPRPFTVAATNRAEISLSQAWDTPGLWWPDTPNLYRLRTTIRVAGKPVDVRETTFGFSEWSARGKDFLLNGVPWHVWADTFTAPTRDAWLKFYKEKNETTVRFWGVKWMELPPEQALDFFDRGGVAVRRSGILDGEAIGYHAMENDPELKKLYGSDIKIQLMQNWRDQVVAQVRAERNHPSVMLWSIENEWLYINCINLFGGHMDKFEAEVLKVSDAVRAVDPTRLTMSDGGGANKDNSMPVHGNHYVFGDITKYPDLAYDVNVTGGGRGRWVWDEQRPRFLGEDFFMEGYHPEFSYLAGEQVFTGKAGSLPGVGLAARMLTEGYRWAGFGGFHFWMTQSATDQSYYKSFAPRAVFCREWDWTFASGQTVPRTLAIFKDTHDAAPITFSWTLNLDGKKVGGETTTHKVAPGANEKLNLSLAIPKVARRAEGQLLLVLDVNGKQVFADEKPVSVLPAGGRAAEAAAAGFAIYDPNATTADFLKARGVLFTTVADLNRIPESARVLLVGRDALDASQSTSSALAAWASSGHRVIVLEQTNALRYQALPCDMEPAHDQGGVAFAEDLDHPVLRGLQQNDFFTWSPGSTVYRDAYLKPTRGAKSLVECDELLQKSALVEVPTGSGVMLLCQLVVGEKLAGSVVAQTLLANLLEYASTYRLEYHPVISVTAGDESLARTLDAIGVKHAAASDPLPAISDSAGEQKSVAIIAATPPHLRALAANLPAIDRFTKAGGWILLHGLTPEGLREYNKIVGVEHLIRPFRRERVTFAPVRSRLSAGLGSGDVALYSSERIFPWADGNFVASDTFSYVVDYDDVAPFAKFPNDFALNLVNGMVSADGWKYIWNVPAPAMPPLDLNITLPRAEELVEMEWVGNTFYYPVTKVQLFFDGKAGSATTFETKPNNDAQTFSINPPIQGQALTIRLADWDKLPGKNQVTGLDNIRLKAKRSADFYARVKPMLNVGGLVEYPRGQGGIVLCNVLFKETESPPVNAAHKQAILATMLRNLKAPFAGGKTVIAGANLKCTPIDLSKFANAYRDEKGWFGDRNFTFAALPTGRQTMAGVQFDIFDFPTSPVPTALMIGGRNTRPAKEITGIPVARKADALFFLQAARIDQRMNDDDRKKKKRFEMARYVIHYADGQSETIPIYSEVDIDDYKQKTPRAIPGAQIAWTHPYGSGNEVAVAYSKQWNNPRPGVEISSVDLVAGKDGRGVPVLLALTAAETKQ